MVIPSSLTVITIITLTTYFNICHGQNYLSYGEECSIQNLDYLCDNMAGLACLSGVCNCSLSHMEYFPDKDICLANVGSECYLDGTANCVDNAVCVEDPFVGTSQCQCDTDFSAVAAPSCDRVNKVDPERYSVICCPVT